jgi:hypothetical protein
MRIARSEEGCAGEYVAAGRNSSQKPIFPIQIMFSVMIQKPSKFPGVGSRIRRFGLKSKKTPMYNLARFFFAFFD